MSRPARLSARLLAVAVGTAAAGALVAPPSPAAAAGDMWFSKSSGRFALVDWLELGTLPAGANAPGNAHFGSMIVQETSKGRATAFGNVFDVECAPGVTPYNPGGHHGGAEEPPAQEGCVLKQVRFIEGGSLSFVLDRKLTKATVKGTLAVGSGHGGPTGAPGVDITLLGTGSTTTERSSSTYSDGTTTYTSRYTSTGRGAVVQQPSTIGPMGFDDEDGESSTARFGTYRSVERGRS